MESLVKYLFRKTCPFSQIRPVKVQYIFENYVRFYHLLLLKPKCTLVLRQRFEGLFDKSHWKSAAVIQVSETMQLREGQNSNYLQPINDSCFHMFSAITHTNNSLYYGSVHTWPDHPRSNILENMRDHTCHELNNFAPQGANSFKNYYRRTRINKNRYECKMYAVHTITFH